MENVITASISMKIRKSNFNSTFYFFISQYLTSISIFMLLINERIYLNQYNSQEFDYWSKSQLKLTKKKKNRKSKPLY